MQYQIQSLIKKYNFRPIKRLGQNFLVDKKVLEKIIEAAGLSSQDIVLEIGPGLGILTAELAKRVKKVVAVEKDKKMCEALAHVLNVESVENVQIVHGDALRFERLERLERFEHYKLVANLPYYITSPVIRKFLETENPPQEMVLMVQKEVAQRICAKPPQMNLLAVAVQFYAEPKIISYVSKNSFWPQPKVDSAIIKIIPKPIPKIETRQFFNIVKTGFSSKRKMLKNNLEKKLKINPPAGGQKIKVIFEQLNINPKIRAENLSVQDWVKLYEKIH